MSRTGRVAIVDGDDTLWFVEHLYDEARSAAAEIVAGEGLDAALWDDLERKIDVERVATMGLSPERFPSSCVEAYREVAARTWLEPRPSVEKAILQSASRVFCTVAPLADGAASCLDDLRPHFDLVLLTKGDESVQRRRVSESGLQPFFDRVVIVNHKDEGVFGSLLEQLGADPRESWSIGNSLPSDINPALRLGLSAIWIDAHVWEHERREVVPHTGDLIVASTLRDATTKLLSRTVRV